MSKKATYPFLTELARKTFPMLDLDESKILATIANEGSQTIYDLKNKVDVPYGTLHSKLKELYGRDFLTYKKREEEGRLKIPYTLTFRGKLASLTSPIIDLSKLKDSLVNELHIGVNNERALTGVLSTWFYGLENLGVNLESIDFTYTFFEQTFNAALTNVLGRECLLKGIGFFGYLREIGIVLDRTEEEALRHFLDVWMQFAKANADFWLRMLERNLDIPIRPLISGSFFISNNPPASIVLQLEFPRLVDAWTKLLEKASKQDLTSREVKQLLEENSKEVPGISSSYCQAMCLDGYCRLSKEFCRWVMEKDPEIWRCKHIAGSLMSPDIARKIFESKGCHSTTNSHKP